MSAKQLCVRAKHRLKIAAGLLRGSGRNAKNLHLTRATFYDGIQALIAALAPEAQWALKQQTDWVEAYDRASAEVSTSERAGRGAA